MLNEALSRLVSGATIAHSPAAKYFFVRAWLLAGAKFSLLDLCCGQISPALSLSRTTMTRSWGALPRVVGIGWNCPAVFSFLLPQLQVTGNCWIFERTSKAQSCLLIMNKPGPFSNTYQFDLFKMGNWMGEEEHRAFQEKVVRVGVELKEPDMQRKFVLTPVNSF